MNVKDVLNRLGGTVAVAKLLGISSQAVSQWEKVPVERAFELERCTGGKVTVRELRPDLFGPSRGEAA